MSEPLIISNPDLSELSEQFCEIFKNVILQQYAKHGHVVGAWPGGRSLLKFFPGISGIFDRLDPEILKALEFFQVDERVYQEFNRELLEQNLFQSLKDKKLITESQIHYYPTDLEPAEGLVQYAKTLSRFGNCFNYSMLGAGNPHIVAPDGEILQYDCHVAGIFANHPSSQPHAESFFYYYDSPKPPAGRITATYSLLSRSEWSFLFIIGEQKREVLNEFLNKDVSITRAPIKIALEAQKCVLVTDLKV